MIGPREGDEVVEFDPPGRKPNGHAAPADDGRFAPIDSMPDDAPNAGPHAVDAPMPVPRGVTLKWADLAGKTPPTRQWIIDRWLPAGEVTLLSGPGGTGKTGVCQALAGCVAMGSDYIDSVPHARKSLMWASEDNHDELWRRHVAISRWTQTPLEDFEQRFTLTSYHGESVELAVPVGNKIVGTALLSHLREQIGDLGAELVVLDNVARLFAGNENDRYQVSTFIALLAWAAQPTNASILLLGHPAKAIGSEFSGSTAWEGAVRTRLYLGRKHPDAKDQKPDEDDEIPQDDDVRWLCKRKANYSTADYRRIKYLDGVMCPEDIEVRSGGPAVSPDYAATVVLQAVRKLKSMDEFGTTSTASPSYLPRLAKAHGLLDRLSEKQFAKAMNQLRADRKLVIDTIGYYPNRSPRKGLTEPAVTQGMSL